MLTYNQTTQVTKLSNETRALVTRLSMRTTGVPKAKLSDYRITVLKLAASCPPSETEVGRALVLLYREPENDLPVYDGRMVAAVEKIISRWVSWIWQQDPGWESADAEGEGLSMVERFSA